VNSVRSKIARLLDPKGGASVYEKVAVYKAMLARAKLAYDIERPTQASLAASTPNSKQETHYHKHEHLSFHGGDQATDGIGADFAAIASELGIGITLRKLIEQRTSGRAVESSPILTKCQRVSRNV
jgi:hypothetical protein